MVLDIGCGKRKIEPDAVGIDVSPDSAAEHVWNLDQYPWPLESDCFDRIHMSHVIEHLEDPMRAMAEVYRVARDGAEVFVDDAAFQLAQFLRRSDAPAAPGRGQLRVLHREGFPELRRVAVPVRYREGGADVRREFRAGRYGAVAGGAVAEVVRAARGVGVSRRSTSGRSCGRGRRSRRSASMTSCTAS